MASTRCLYVCKNKSGDLTGTPYSKGKLCINNSDQIRTKLLIIQSAKIHVVSKRNRTEKEKNVSTSVDRELQYKPRPWS